MIIRKCISVLLLVFLCSCGEIHSVSGRQLRNLYPAITKDERDIDCHFYSQETDELVWSERNFELSDFKKLRTVHEISDDYDSLGSNSFKIILDEDPFKLFYLYYFQEEKKLVVSRGSKLSDKYLKNLLDKKK